ncbi:DUF680 domain-containing protein [Mesorhizobium sp. B2-4-13]|uniref:DUF680 domain-containing protein n=1 Tax=Mesorhizobium sp. B2-4-13 TaxID=2589936 RepID=UPI00114DFF4F|nr:DUF680 domain-containing protein [Mesorhizobium sp. B2-4-13]TPK83121.1 DUF680 domain-containing protein [Mesorhizobium sp. B2-4-13]
MTKIAIATAALLIAANTAFAGSDKFGSDNANQPTGVTTDNVTTTSIGKSEATNQKPVVQGSNRDLFGSR